MRKREEFRASKNAKLPANVLVGSGSRKKHCHASGGFQKLNIAELCCANTFRVRWHVVFRRVCFTYAWAAVLPHKIRSGLEHGVSVASPSAYMPKEVSGFCNFMRFSDTKMGVYKLPLLSTSIFLIYTTQYLCLEKSAVPRICRRLCLKIDSITAMCVRSPENHQKTIKAHIYVGENGSVCKTSEGYVTWAVSRDPARRI
jgi:hypothetical protein